MSAGDESVPGPETLVPVQRAGNDVPWGIVLDEQCVIRDVAFDSPAYHAGLFPDCGTIVAVGECRFTTFDGVVTSLQAGELMCVLTLTGTDDDFSVIKVNRGERTRLRLAFLKTERDAELAAREEAKRVEAAVKPEAAPDAEESDDEPPPEDGSAGAPPSDPLAELLVGKLALPQYLKPFRDHGVDLEMLSCVRPEDLAVLGVCRDRLHARAIVLGAVRGESAVFQPSPAPASERFSAVTVSDASPVRAESLVLDSQRPSPDAHGGGGGLVPAESLVIEEDGGGLTTCASL